MVHHFDHRFGTYEGQTESQANQGKLPELDEAQHADPDRSACRATGCPPTRSTDGLARQVGPRLATRLAGHLPEHTNTDGDRELAPAGRCRSHIPADVPDATAAVESPASIANLDSFVLDYVARQKIGGTISNLLTSEAASHPLPRALSTSMRMVAPARRSSDWLLPASSN